jgi:TonB family protein
MPDQQLNLADLDKRLETRVAEKKERKLPVYYRWAAAAAILLLAGIGVMKMWPLPEKKEIVKTIVLHDSVAPAAITNESGQYRDEWASKKPVAPAIRQSAPVPAVPMPVEEKEVILQSDAVAENKDIAYKEAPVLSKLENADMSKRDTIVNADLALAPPATAKTEVMRSLNGSVAGISVSQGKAAHISRKRTLKGKVTDNNNNPLPGVSVFASKNGTMTDSEGNFAIPVDDTEDVQLNVNYIGYESKKLEVNNRQNNLNIAINEDNKALSEVVITTAGIKRKQKAFYQAPMPGEGFDSYQQYLVKHVRYPASAGNIKGTVKVAFTVKADGSLKDFKVINKLQPDCDTEAIRVIKEGPAWIPASDGKSGRVQVDVPFTP